ncbi:polyprenyl synthetase family protein [Candidatus Dojkabacteria bacterium]|uniref:Polyprenyl synthetase family protein n=1 Tax=Candidatus Dojkabacteria bacterium TaxID=2099670 RepID=A0A955RK45_9BACT|nr:polyprenyl synthetase family protein [Candidatus Dojkabacteria bacterium]
MKNSHATQARETLQLVREKLDEKLDIFFQQLFKDIKQSYSEYSYESFKPLWDVTARGGKRLRGSFVIKTYELIAHDIPNSVYDIGMAIEMTHAYLLILDDIADRSNQRRGGKTAHKMIERYYKENKTFKTVDAEHFGNSIAIFVALVNQHLASNVILDSSFPVEKKLEVLHFLNRTIYETVHGQLNDIFNEIRVDVSEEDIVNVLKLKTGLYTYENPISIGAALAGASIEEQKILRDYAIPAGIAFQIQDDILGVFGDPEKLGKPNLDDIREGKMTLLVHHALKVGNESQKAIIEHSLGNPEFNSDMLEDVRKVMIDTGSLDYSKTKATEYVMKAKQELKQGLEFNWSEEGYNYLMGIADYMIQRKL